MRTETTSSGHFEGNTQDCLKHYLSQLPWSDKGCAEARKPMADFLGVRSDSIRRWLVTDIQPIGLVLVKLRYFLEEKGYRITELETLKKPVRMLGKLIATQQITWEEAVERIQFSNASELLQVLHGNRGLSSERMVIVARICADYSEDEETHHAAAPPWKNQMAPTETPNKKGVRIEEDVIHLLDALNGLCAVLEPRLEYMLSEGFTPEQRQLFRERAGRVRVFDLANRFFGLNKQLNALCSEKAREITSTDKHQR